MRPFVSYYDTLVQTKDYDGEASTALAFLGLAAGARVLEIGAGTGGHSMAIARRGIAVTAVEIDPEMASLGQAKTSGMPEIRWHAGPVETAPEIVVDGACALFYVINYVRTRRALSSLLAAVRARVPAGRRLTFDCWNGLEAMRGPAPVSRRTFELPEGGTLVQEIETVVDIRRQEAALVYRFDIRPRAAAASQAEERLKIRLWTLRELEEALDDASFRVASVRDGRSPDRDATAESGRLWITAEAA